MACRLNPAASDLFLDSPQAKNSFCIFKGLVKDTEDYRTENIHDTQSLKYLLYGP